jgi:hypothetical protein
MLLSKFYGPDFTRRRKLQDYGGAIFLPRKKSATGIYQQRLIFFSGSKKYVLLHILFL